LFTHSKQIDFDAIFTLNPNLADTPPSALNVTKKGPVRPTIQNAAATRGSLRLKPPTNRQTMVSSNFNLTSKSEFGMTGSENGQFMAPTPLSSNNGYGKSMGNVSNIGNTTSAISNNGNNNNNGSDMAPPKSAFGMQQSAASRRRSNVVKEVDRIKKQREERRYRQAEQKAEKMELMSNVEPGNPNWEFLGMIKEYRSQIEYKPITVNDSVDTHQITVAVRKRPMNKKECQKKDIDVITIPNKNTLAVHEPRHKVDLTRCVLCCFF
jgi:kinesin family protein 2/24